MNVKANTKTNSKLSATSAARALVAVTLAAGAAVAATPSANAWTSSSLMRTSPVIYPVVGSHENRSVNEIPNWQRVLTESGPYIYREGSGTQYVALTYTIYRWNGAAWAKVGSTSSSGTIGSTATGVWLRGFTHRNANAGYYYVSMNVTWTTPIGGLIKNVTINMNSSGDYQCNTTYSCNATQGYIYLS